MICRVQTSFRPSRVPPTRHFGSVAVSQWHGSATHVISRRRQRLRCASQETQGESVTLEGSAEEIVELPKGDMCFKSPSPNERFWTSCRLAFALPWRRFKKNSLLTFTLSEEIQELSPPPFSKALSLPSICEALIKAAYDPRVCGVFAKIETVDCGWAKIKEIRRHLEFFNASGKFSIVYMESGGEKEYFLASAFQEIYVPPSANVYLRGLALSGTFVRGALDKAGIEPQVKRIGNYKSAGDQLLREEMSDYQKEQLQALLDDIYDGFVHEVARSRGISVEAIEKAIEEGYVSMEDYQKAGFFTALKYKS